MADLNKFMRYDFACGVHECSDEVSKALDVTTKESSNADEANLMKHLMRASLSTQRQKPMTRIIRNDMEI